MAEKTQAWRPTPQLAPHELKVKSSILGSAALTQLTNANSIKTSRLSNSLITDSQYNKAK